MALILALAIIAFAALFHAHWALGGRTGLSVSLPQHADGSTVMARRLPFWRPAAAGVVACLAALAIILLAVAGELSLPVPSRLLRAALLFIGTAFVLRAMVPNPFVGFFKTIRTTRWAKYDTWLYSPLFLLLGLLTIWQAAG